MIERKFVNEGKTRVMLDLFLKKRLVRAGYAGVDLQKTPLITRIIIRVERPGLVIGRKGQTLRQLTQEIEEKFSLENIQIKVEDISVPELDAIVMANRIARSLERGLHFRKVMLRAKDQIMEAGALGCEIVISGKLVGKGGMARKERTTAGYLKKAGEPAKQVRVAHAQALKKAGIIGVTVRIAPPDMYIPEKVNVDDALKETGDNLGNNENKGN